MYSYLQLTRWKNLLFLLFIQWVMVNAVIYPILQIYGFDLTNHLLPNLLLYIATAFIAAGGYIINDYYDVKIDRINHPDRIIITNTISAQQAMRFYVVISTIGVVSGIALALLLENVLIGVIFVFMAGLMWFYSASYKRLFFIGNLTIAFAAAMSIFLTAMVHNTLLENAYDLLIFQTPIPRNIYFTVGCFALFALLTTLLRELIKDIQDIEGDRDLECRTIPIKWGINRAKWIVFGYILITIAAIYHVAYHYIDYPNSDYLTWQYLTIGITIPLIISGILVHRAHTPTHYRQAGNWAKTTMLTGTLYAFILYYLQAKKYGISLFNLFIVQ